MSVLLDGVVRARARVEAHLRPRGVGAKQGLPPHYHGVEPASLRDRNFRLREKSEHELRREMHPRRVIKGQVYCMSVHAFVQRH